MVGPARPLRTYAEPNPTPRAPVSAARPLRPEPRSARDRHRSGGDVRSRAGSARRSSWRAAVARLIPAGRSVRRPWHAACGPRPGSCPRRRGCRGPASRRGRTRRSRRTGRGTRRAVVRGPAVAAQEADGGVPHRADRQVVRVGQGQPVLVPFDVETALELGRAQAVLGVDLVHRHEFVLGQADVQTGGVRGHPPVTAAQQPPERFPRGLGLDQHGGSHQHVRREAFRVRAVENSGQPS